MKDEFALKEKSLECQQINEDLRKQILTFE